VVTLYNPHVDDFLGIPPQFRILKRKALRKYGFFIDGTLEQSRRLRVVVDGTISAFVPEQYFVKFPRFIRMWISQAEFSWWVRINGMCDRIEQVDVSAGNHSDEILLMFSYKCAIGCFAERESIFSAFPVVVAHLSHYFISTAEKSANLRKLPNVWLAGDSDISSSPYFRHFFGWYQKPFLVLPFAVNSRFKMQKPFDAREMSCVATGSFHDLDHEVPRYKYSDFQEFFGINTYHPIRKLIYEQSNKYSGLLVSRVSPYRGREARGGLIKRWIKHFAVSQKAYFSINIVDLYNRYQFAIVGEEASGFPALGAFESMACGCILIANPDAYNGLGMEPWKHYLPHNGSMESILAAIKYAGALDDHGSSLAYEGCLFIEEHYRAEDVLSLWQESLNTILVENNE